MVREGRVFISSGTKPDFGASYSVQVLEGGAQVTSGSSGTTITVRAGHGFAAGDKVMRGTDTTTFSATNVVDSVTSTTVEMHSLYTVAAGDMLVNLGVDSSTGATPNYDGAGLTVYTTQDYTATATNNTVTTDSYGRYRYYHKGIVRWELVRVGSTLISLYTDTSGISTRTEGFVRDMSEFATAGSGTSASPWTGWDPYCVEGYAIKFPSGFYSAPTVSVPITISNAVAQTIIEGDGSGVSVITITGGTGQFRVYGSGAGTRVLFGVVIRGLTIRAGINNTSTGLFSFENADGQCTVDDIFVDATSAFSLTTGFYFLNCEHIHIGMITARGWSAVAAAAGNIATGVKFYTDDGIQRGNIRSDFIAVANATTGLSCSSSGGSLAGMNFGIVKVANGTLVDGTLGISLEGNTEQVTFGDVHLERLNNGLQATSVENLVMTNGLASNIKNNAGNAGAAITITGGDGGYLVCRLDTCFNGVVFTTTTTRYVFIRTAAGTITGVLFTDSSSGTNVYLNGQTIAGPLSIERTAQSLAALTLTNTNVASQSSPTLEFQPSAGNPKGALQCGTSGQLQFLASGGSVVGTIDQAGTITAGLNLVSSGSVRGVKATQALTSSAAIATINRHLIDITNTSGANTPTLVAPAAQDGQILVLRCVALTAGSITLADSGNCNLSAAWIPTAGGTLTLMASGVIWYELARSVN